MQHIRNFSIIAHIDHGKSTLSDRFIQICQGLSQREMKQQVLDSMDIERERGITIKAQSVTLSYTSKDGEIYKLNFIDTPGHVDFSYEVSRSLAACEGALLLVDATQGVEAQTIANCYSAIEQNLEVIPVINKIDLPSAEPEIVCKEIENIIGIEAIGSPICSAKTGFGVIDVLERIIAKVPPPQGNRNSILQALIIDSWFDPYLGIISLVRVFNGKLKIHDKIKVISTGRIYQVEQLGIFTPKMNKLNQLSAGDVGLVIAGIKDIHGAPVGDTLTLASNLVKNSLPGFKKVYPQIYAGMFPVNSIDFNSFREALEKLSLNDASLFFEPESSQTFGFGFRCGFLGKLHMEIIQERLEREYQLNLITSAPTVIYKVILKNGDEIEIHNPIKLPKLLHIEEILEPIVRASIVTTPEYVGALITLCINRRGCQIDLNYMERQVFIVYDIPMIEVISDFFNQVKSVSRGHASLDYVIQRYQSAKIVLLDILINSEKIDALASIVDKDQAIYKGRKLVKKLQEIIPKQMFEISIQACINSKIIARSTVKALRKNVLAKCYGGDVSRKRKLLEKQKLGKKRMKKIGNVEIPQEAFLSVLHNKL